MMNPGPIEEAGKVATSVVESFKSQPLMLALVVLQVVIIGSILYSTIHRQEAYNKQFAAVFTLLDKCLNRP
jgi:hypothetical protein